jgi:peptidoglycan/LPS O-acetylase OafA/YrhL
MQDLQARSPYPRPSSSYNAFTYMPTVDGLRGIAILLVLCYHAPFLFRDLPEFFGEQTPWAMLGVLGRMSLGGWIGVDLFFVISGFLITSILIRLRDGGGTSWVFWGRRGLRILPLAMLYLLVLLVLTWLGDPLKLLPHFEGWAWYAFYLGNIHIAIYGWQPLAVMILWSLAIEEQFYLVWPLLVRACRGHRLLWWSGGIMAVAPVIRAITLSAADYPATYVFTLCRLDAFAAGAVVAVIFGNHNWHAEAVRLCKRLAPFATVVMLITCLVPFSPSLPETRPWFFSVFGYSWLAVSFAILLGASLNADGLVGALLKSSVLTFLGRRCYGLYLWHVLIAGFVTAWLHSLQVGFIAHVLLWLGALVIVASGSWLFIEEPILRLKRFLPYVQRQPVQLEPHRVASTAAWWPPVVGPNGLPEPQTHVFQNKGAER